MIISLLFSEPVLFFLWMLAIVYGITVHEFSHVFAAYAQGDDTGKFMGRLTLNPLAHVDFFGIIMLLFVGFGWGKPAPFNPNNLRNQRFGEILVAIAGPLANFISVIVFGIAIKVLIIQGFGYPIRMLREFGFDVMHQAQSNLLVEFLFALIILNIILMVFNLLPIPPLDGSKLLFEILPSKYDNFKNNFKKNGPLILLGLIFADNFLGINIFGFIFEFFLKLAVMAVIY